MDNDNIKQYQKEYRLKNKEKLNAYRKEWEIKNKEYLRGYEKKRGVKNKEKNKEYRKEYNIKNKENRREWNRKKYIENKSEILQRSKDWHIKNPDKSKNARLKREFGIGFEEYSEMLKNRDSKCDICKQLETRKDHRTGKVLFLSVDHNHTTGKIRGLLCTRCNMSIGYLVENIEILKNAIKYLEGQNE